MKPEIKRIIVLVTSDLVTDNRVHKVCTTLAGMSFHVLLAGRELPFSLPMDQRRYSIVRFRLPFTKGPLFYASYNIRLFFFLLLSRFDIILANDLDTLPAGYIASKIRNRPLVYDSHEYFTEVPELVSRPGVKKVWEWIEKQIVPRLKYAITVNESLSRMFENKYGVGFHVVRNVPLGSMAPAAEQNVLPDREKYIIYQGALNINRGLEQLILSMKSVEGAKLVIAGDGDIKAELEKLAVEEGLSDKVKFLGRIPIDQLPAVTAVCSAGVSIEEDMGLNYHFALPNKLFDYIQARVPVLVTELPEMAAVVRHYNIGKVIAAPEPSVISEALNEMLHDKVQRAAWQKNLERAAAELIWENEEKVLHQIFGRFL